MLMTRNFPPIQILPFAAAWMDLDIIIPSELSQKEKEKYHLCYLKIHTNEHISIEKDNLRLRRQTYG